MESADKKNRKTKIYFPRPLRYKPFDYPKILSTSLLRRSKNIVKNIYISIWCTTIKLIFANIKINNLT